MYNIAWGQKRIVNKTRRDINQKLEQLDQIRDLRTRKKSLSPTDSPNSEIMSSPKPTFQPIQNRNKPNNGRQMHHHHETITMQHQELVKYFSDSWEKVCKELDSNPQNGPESRGDGALLYKRVNVHPALDNFKPFDLEAYWGNKVYKNSTQPR